ncbi:type II secretion system protein [bacterium]|nr:type II secretion system protein [bacterium]
MKRFGFTLSEVMITISLLGVVAALTIANVGYSIQHKARVSQFQTAYSNIETALANIENEKGGPYACYYCANAEDVGKFGLDRKTAGSYNSEVGCSSVRDDTACENLKNDLLRHLGVSHHCNTNAVSEGCLPANYPKTGITNCFNENYTKVKAHVLDNSMVLIESPRTQDKGISVFAIDVNGRKGPNKWGQDIFTFSIRVSKGNTVGSKYYVSKVGIYPSNWCQPGYTDGAKLNDKVSKSSVQMLEEIINYDN